MGGAVVRRFIFLSGGCDLNSSVPSLHGLEIEVGMLEELRLDFVVRLAWLSDSGSDSESVG
jgi:hypothetical protein